VRVSQGLSSEEYSLTRPPGDPDVNQNPSESGSILKAMDGITLFSDELHSGRFKR
jgi:hypothetical protein